MSKTRVKLDNKLKVNQLINLMVNYVGNSKSPSTVSPIMLWGSPGVGKSQAMRQVGEKLQEKTGKKVNVTDVRLLLFNPVDLRGIPVADAKRELAVWLKPQIFQMDESKDVLNILILDEISAAPPSVQAAAYQIVLDRQIGEHKIPDNCLIMCAGNKVTDKSVAYKMPKALANRLCHIEIEVDYEDWKIWALKNNVNEKIMGYLNFKRGSELFKFEPNSEDNSFPTPRSWEKVSNVLGVLELSQAMPLVSGHIGSATALDFYTYTKVYNKIPNIEEIKKGKCKDVPKEPDVNFALTSSLVSHARKAGDDELSNILEYGLLLEGEFAVLLFKDMIKASEELQAKVVRLPVFNKFVSKYKFLIDESY